MARQKSRSLNGNSTTRETSCHICHISSGTSRRKFAFCTKCSAIVCKPCVENTGAYWSSVQRQRDWACQKCLGSCPCKKCYQASGSVVFSDLRKRTRSEYDPKQSRKSRNTPEPQSLPEEAGKVENTSAITSDTSTLEETHESPKKQKLEHTHDPQIDHDTHESSEAENSAEQPDLSYVQELVAKNQQCLEYLARTTRLLEMIQREQKNIEKDLSRLAKADPTIVQPVNNTTTFSLESDSASSLRKPTATT